LAITREEPVWDITDIPTPDAQQVSGCTPFMLQIVGIDPFDIDAA
jgi:hypothetical protein